MKADEYKKNNEAGKKEKKRKERNPPLGFNATINIDTNISFHLHVLDFALLLQADAADGIRITTFRRNLLPSSSMLIAISSYYYVTTTLLIQSAKRHTRSYE
jgi:hypothetical protein